MVTGTTDERRTANNLWRQERAERILAGLLMPSDESLAAVFSVRYGVSVATMREIIAEVKAEAAE